jgi:HAL2 family 3'(2'),5'-bisphosphate nucleotidase
MLAAARAAVLRAAQVTREVQRALDRIKVVTKDDRSPVTLADYAAQAVVAEHLQRALGPVRLVGEERADALRTDAHAALRALAVEAVAPVWPEATEAALLDAIDVGAQEPDPAGFWTLDPVDGTKGFLRGEQYAVSLAYVVGGEVVLGALACPNLDPDLAHDLGTPGRGVLAVAARGEGAWQGTLQEGAALTRMAMPGPATDTLRTCESVEAAHSNHDAHAQILAEAGLTAQPVRLDSQAKYMVVARGQADAYLRLPSSKGYVEKIWDHAAGALVATEAGRVVTDFSGRVLDFGHGRRLEENRGIMAAHPEHHARLLAAIRKLGFASA